MSEKESPQENQAASPIGEIAHGPSGFDAFLDAHQKKLMIIGVLLVLGVVSYVIVSGLQQEARATAAAEISEASDLPTLREAYEKHKSTPAGAVALDKIAKIQWQDQRHGEAIETLESLTSEYPEHPFLGSVHLTLGNYHRELNQLDKAKASYEAAAASNSAVSSTALVALGDLSLREDASDEADTLYGRVSSEFGQRHSDFKQIASTHEKLVGTAAPTEITPAPEPPKPTSPVLNPTTPDLRPLPPLTPAPASIPSPAQE